MNRFSLPSEELVHLSSGLASSAVVALQTATAETKRFARFILSTYETSDSPAEHQRTPSEAESLVAEVYARWAREDSTSSIHAPPPAAPPPQPELKAFISEKSFRRSPQEKDTTLPASASNAESPTLVTSPASVTLPFSPTPTTSPNSPASTSLSGKLDRRRDGQPSPYASLTSPRIRSRRSQETVLNAAREQAMLALIDNKCGAETIPCPRESCKDELRDVGALASHLHIHIIDEQACLAGASTRCTYRSRRELSATSLGAFAGPFRRLVSLAVCHRAHAGTSN